MNPDGSSSADGAPFARWRDRMVERQPVDRGVRDTRVLSAMRAVLREAFADRDLADEAYDDRPLPIGAGRSVSQPYMAALMAEAAGIGPGDRVLVVGAGCGYAAAVPSHLAAEVHAVERVPVPGEAARRRLAALGRANVSVHGGDGRRVGRGGSVRGHRRFRGGRRIPPALEAQLPEGGRLVAPVWPPGAQRPLRPTRRGTGFKREDLGPMALVPLVEGSP